MNSRNRPGGEVDRRHFLQVAGAGVASFTLTSMPFGLARSAAAQTGPRSLVCIFLAGGADSFNMYVPRDHTVAGQTHGVYRATRGDFAVAAKDLLPIGNGDFGLHPLLPRMAEASAAGNLAVVTNVGPLARPTTKADYRARRLLPQSLFAHNAQAKLWETASSVLTVDQGWGGSISDVVGDHGSLAPAFSVAGSNSFQSSLGSGYAQLSPSVTISRMRGYDASERDWIPSFGGVEATMQAGLEVAAESPNRLDQAVAEALVRSVVTTEQLEAATQPNAANDVGMDDVNGNDLADQLRVVARLIKNREELGMARQIFFVRLGGWDTHRIQAQVFPRLLPLLDNAVGSFQEALATLGVTDSVTTFTSSDFGRTLTINGDGTDHGWGGHAFVIGGAVKSGAYGTFPSYATTNNPDDIGDGSADFAGRLIPSTAVSQYGATFAKWMGLSSTQIASAFPDLSNFAQANLGFL
ncbi:MAG: DUF1501 domain-containing protein [Acidimicrobiales bacterium]